MQENYPLKAVSKPFAIEADYGGPRSKALRSRRLARPDGTPAAAMHETLAYQHPPAMPKHMPLDPIPFLIETPTISSATAAWLAYRDACASLMRFSPLDLHAKALFEAANRALQWRRELAPEQRFWQGAEEETEGYTLVIGNGEYSRWVPAPMSKSELVALARDVADDHTAPVVVYDRGEEIARVSISEQVD